MCSWSTCRICDSAAASSASYPALSGNCMVQNRPETLRSPRSIPSQSIKLYERLFVHFLSTDIITDLNCFPYIYLYNATGELNIFNKVIHYLVDMSCLQMGCRWATKFWWCKHAKPGKCVIYLLHLCIIPLAQNSTASSMSTSTPKTRHCHFRNHVYTTGWIPLSYNHASWNLLGRKWKIYLVPVCVGETTAVVLHWITLSYLFILYITLTSLCAAVNTSGIPMISDVILRACIASLSELGEAGALNGTWSFRIQQGADVWTTP